jgi:hypothetical protein
MTSVEFTKMTTSISSLRVVFCVCAYLKYQQGSAHLTGWIEVLSRGAEVV